MSASSARKSEKGGAEVRDRIYASALRQFSHRGYASTSLREICEDARTTKPMVYYYFGSKEGLYSSIVNEIIEEMAAAVRSVPGPAGAEREEVMAYCQRYIDHFFANEETIALVLREVFGLGGAPMQALSHGLGSLVRQPLDEILARGMDSGAFRKDDVEGCATAITGILDMFILAHVFGHQVMDRKAILRQAGYYLRGFSGC
ncbi:MAG: TetR/AcrR family transcriptional regulator [Dehalococcoidia bacterium]|nr:TetR/AcrR family transcriptional regulator [Dehalococcoidia bacterium]MCL4231992.1 TetR/AcrR family transcriptional regulator [Dehalococcoidia bacterium]NUQ55086.1 TetR/AcrR family transcriptional regulator [Dehalococcoidia bacterium]